MDLAINIQLGRPFQAKSSAVKELKNWTLRNSRNIQATVGRHGCKWSVTCHELTRNQPFNCFRSITCSHPTFWKVTMVLVVVLVQLPPKLATSNYHHKQKRATGHFPLSRHWTRPLAFPVFRASGFGGAEGFFSPQIGGESFLRLWRL